MRQLKPRDYYTAGEMARVLGCSPRTVLRRMNAGTLRGCHPPGRQGCCFKAVFERYLLEHDVPLDRLAHLDRGLGLAAAFTAPKGGR